MKTEISTFCDDYSHILQTLPGFLTKTVECLEKCPEETITKKPKASLNDVRARLKSLIDKLEHQQAYLLIFGPLKSGKSTLMNAISRNYVSEVTSLPGYPCLVYVGHREEEHFSVTRYNGRESTFSDGRVLHDVIADCHVALASQIRQVEDRGESFEPRSHFSEAIRRVDMKFPIENLRESNTILVDTPGLYSRMNFGYDLLTREFRDSAACAVFVVKTDNLFLEQVFNEFNELLELFSRIFLVINVDSGKRDLKPDGSLLPSAESAEPEKIIEAFKTLSMAGPLRTAHEMGRVRIHAIDLLSAASAYLKTNAESALAEVEEESADEASSTPAPDPAPELEDRQVAAFEGFISDLTSFLNSSDYTMTFMRDSLRQGQTLCDEAAAVGDGIEMEALRERQEGLRDRIAEADAKLDALNRLLIVDWAATFEGMRAESLKRAVEIANTSKGDLEKKLGHALDRWFESTESLKALQQAHWAPVLVDAGRSQAEDGENRMRTAAGQMMGGAVPPEEVVADLNSVGFSLTPTRDAALENVKGAFDEAVYGVAVQSSEIPVRKSFWDYVLFRRQETVRDRLFGAPKSVDREISPEVKQNRLNEASREAFVEIARRILDGKFPELPKNDVEALVTRYVDSFCTDIDDRLRARRTEVMDERRALVQPFEVTKEIFEVFADLRQETIDSVENISGLEAAVAKPESSGPVPTE